MKKLVLLLLATMPLSFIGCSSDDDDNNKGNSSKIIGVWYETAYWDTGSFSGTPNTWHTWGLVGGYVHEFKDDNTYKYYWSLSDYKEGKADAKYSGSYTFDGQNLAVNGGFKRKITFTEDGKGFEWEQTAICTKYTGK